MSSIKTEKKMNYAVQSISLTKEFLLEKIAPVTLKELFLRRIKENNNKTKLIKALDNVNFEIKKGSSVGIIGHNGAGKSTLLKLICGLGVPSKGSVKVAGNIGALLKLAVGFHSELSGRENIRTGCFLNGIPKDLMSDYENQIIEFSELEEFIDFPTRTYSDGMFLRLAFSTAITFDPEILVIDELLSVGDANFKKKCIKKINSLKTKGTTMVITSHDTEQIENMCDQVIVLDKGKLIIHSATNDGIKCYIDIMKKNSS